MKARIVAESLQPGARVADMAARYDTSCPVDFHLAV